MEKRYPRIISYLQTLVESDQNLKTELENCITKAFTKWKDQPKAPDWALFNNLEGFYDYLNYLLNTTPADSDFDDLFHEIYFVISQDGNALQKNKEFSNFRTWLEKYVDAYGHFLNTPQSGNNLSTFINDPTFEIDLFTIPPGGFTSFNNFFCRYMRPGERPVGAATLAYTPPSSGHPVGPNPVFTHDDRIKIHENMCDDSIITVPADSVYKGCWSISEDDTITVDPDYKGCQPFGKNDRITVSKGNTYAIEELLEGSKYAECFKGGIFTHSYLTVFTYHRYHVPVSGTVLETNIISGDVYANVVLKDGHLSATDGTGYQFKQERSYIIMDSPVGKVALVPIGMDFVSSCDLSVDEGVYLNKGDEFGYFLFGGSDLIMLFEKEIEIYLKRPDDPKIDGYFYKLGQVFGKLK